MPTLTLTITEAQARVLSALEMIDLKTIDERMAPYLRDIYSNAAGVRFDGESRAEAAILLLEEQAVLALEERELMVHLAAEQKALEEVVETVVEEPVAEVQLELDLPVPVLNPADPAEPLYELTPPPEPTPVNDEPKEI